MDGFVSEIIRCKNSSAWLQSMKTEVLEKDRKRSVDLKKNWSLWVEHNVEYSQTEPALNQTKYFKTPCNRSELNRTNICMFPMLL